MPLTIDPNTGQRKFVADVPSSAPRTLSDAFRRDVTEFNNPVTTEAGEFSKGLRSGIEQIKGLGHAVVGAGGALAGQDEFAEERLDSAARNFQRAGRIGPRVTDFNTAVESGENFKDFIAGGAGQALPSMATAVGGGLLGLGGKQLLKKKIREKVSNTAAGGGGTFAATEGLEAGSIFQDVTQDPEARKNMSLSELAGLSFAGAIPAAALDTLPLMVAAKKFGLGISARKELESKILELGKGMSTQMLLEGSTEAAQTIIERAAHQVANKNFDILGEEGINEILTAGTIGAVVGGGTGLASTAPGVINSRIADIEKRDKRKAFDTERGIDQLRAVDDPKLNAHLDSLDQFGATDPEVQDEIESILADYDIPTPKFETNPLDDEVITPVSKREKGLHPKVPVGQTRSLFARSNFPEEIKASGVAPDARIGETIAEDAPFVSSGKTLTNPARRRVEQEDHEADAISENQIMTEEEVFDQGLSVSTSESFVTDQENLSGSEFHDANTAFTTSTDKEGKTTTGLQRAQEEAANKQSANPNREFIPVPAFKAFMDRAAELDQNGQLVGSQEEEIIRLAQDNNLRMGAISQAQVVDPANLQTLDEVQEYLSDRYFVQSNPIPKGLQGGRQTPSEKGPTQSSTAITPDVLTDADFSNARKPSQVESRGRARAIINRQVADIKRNDPSQGALQDELKNLNSLARQTNSKRSFMKNKGIVEFRNNNEIDIPTREQFNKTAQGSKLTYEDMVSGIVQSAIVEKQREAQARFDATELGDLLGKRAELAKAEKTRKSGAIIRERSELSKPGQAFSKADISTEKVISELRDVDPASRGLFYGRNEKGSLIGIRPHAIIQKNFQKHFPGEKMTAKKIGIALQLGMADTMLETNTTLVQESFTDDVIVFTDAAKHEFTLGEVKSTTDIMAATKAKEGMEILLGRLENQKYPDAARVARVQKALSQLDKNIQKRLGFDEKAQVSINQMIVADGELRFASMELLDAQQAAVVEAKAIKGLLEQPKWKKLFKADPYTVAQSASQMTHRAPVKLPALGDQYMWRRINFNVSNEHLKSSGKRLKYGLLDLQTSSVFQLANEDLHGYFTEFYEDFPAPYSSKEFNQLIEKGKPAVKDKEGNIITERVKSLIEINKEVMAAANKKLAMARKDGVKEAYIKRETQVKTDEDGTVINDPISLPEAKANFDAAIAEQVGIIDFATQDETRLNTMSKDFIKEGLVLHKEMLKRNEQIETRIEGHRNFFKKNAKTFSVDGLNKAIKDYAKAQSQLLLKKEAVASKNTNRSYKMKDFSQKYEKFTSLSLSNELTLSTKTPTIEVWAGTGQNAEFSNLTARPFKWKGKQYYSVEHAYQTNKSGSHDAATYALYDKKAGRKIPGKKQAKGDTKGLMNQLVLRSFEQNPKAAQLLRETGDAVFTHLRDKGIWKEAFPDALHKARAELGPIVKKRDRKVSQLLKDYNEYKSSFGDNRTKNELEELFDGLKEPTYFANYAQIAAFNKLKEQETFTTNALEMAISYNKIHEKDAIGILGTERLPVTPDKNGYLAFTDEVRQTLSTAKAQVVGEVRSFWEKQQFEPRELVLDEQTKKHEGQKGQGGQTKAELSVLDSVRLGIYAGLSEKHSSAAIRTGAKYQAAKLQIKSAVKAVAKRLKMEIEVLNFEQAQAFFQMTAAELSGKNGLYFQGKIYIKENLSPEVMREVIGHEIGHGVFESHLRKAGTEVRDAIHKDFTKWRDNIRGDSVHALMKSKKAFNTAMQYITESQDRSFQSLSTEDQAYLLDFEEWFADQVAVWSTRTDKPKTMLGKFFKAIADVIARVLGRQGTTNINEFLDGIATRDVVTSIKDRSARFLSAVKADKNVEDNTLFAHLLKVASNNLFELKTLGNHLSTMFSKQDMALLGRAFTQGNVRSQLFKLYPDATARNLLESDLNATVAAGLVQWSQNRLTVGPQIKSVYENLAGKVAKSFKGNTEFQKHDKALEKIAQGEVLFGVPQDFNLTTPRTDAKAFKEVASIAEAMTKMGEIFNTVFFAANDRMHMTKNPAIIKIANMFHTKTGTRLHKQGYFQDKQQHTGRFLTAATRVLKPLDAAQKEAVLVELRTGKLVSNEAKAMRKLFDSMYVYAQKKGVDVKLRKDYVPRVWNKDFVAQNQGQLEDILSKYGIENPRSAVDGILENAQENEIDEFAITYTPNLAASKMRTLGQVPDTVLAEAGFIANDIEFLTVNYTEALVKRAEYTARLGEDNKKLIQMTEQARAFGATDKDIELVHSYIQAMMGITGHETNQALASILGLKSPPASQKIHPAIQQVLSTVIVIRNLALLSLATFTSLADPLGISVRTGSLSDTGKALGIGMKEIFNSITGQESELKHLADSLGILESHMTNVALQWQYGGNYLAPWARTVNDQFFKWTGLTGLTRITRTMALGAGHSFIARHISDPTTNSQRFLEELNLTSEQVLLTPDGKSVRILTIEERAKAEKAERLRDDSVRAALNQFVDESILRPNAAQRPIWASDPHYMLVFHLKAFMYSFHDRILTRAVTEVGQHNNVAPLVGLMMFIPAMLMIDALRDGIKYGGVPPYKKNWDTMDYVANSMERAGMFGAYQQFLDIGQARRYGGSGLETVAGGTFFPFEAFGNNPTDVLPFANLR